MTLQLHTRSTPFRENQDFKEKSCTCREKITQRKSRGEKIARRKSRREIITRRKSRQTKIPHAKITRGENHGNTEILEKSNLDHFCLKSIRTQQDQ
jgi:hypothetical protein